MPYCQGCGKSLESDWKACPYCQQTVVITVKTNRNREINNLLELAVMKLDQGDIIEFDRLFLHAKEIDVKSGLIQFQDDWRVFDGLINFVESKTSLLVKTYKEMHKTFGPTPTKLVTTNEGEIALSTIEKADLFKHHNPPLFNAVYSELLMVMSKFDLVWDKKKMKTLAKERQNLVTQWRIENDDMTDYKEAKIVLDRSLRRKKELEKIEGDTQTFVVLCFIAGIILFSSI